MGGRGLPTVAAIAVIVAGLQVRAVLDGAVANIGGVALWAVLVACGVVWVRPWIRPFRLFWITVVVSFAVEGFQLTGVPLALYGIHRGFALVLGTSFEIMDLPAYVLGGIGGAGLQAIALIVRPRPTDEAEPPSGSIPPGPP